MTYVWGRNIVQHFLCSLPLLFRFCVTYCPHVYFLQFVITTVYTTKVSFYCLISKLGYLTTEACYKGIALFFQKGDCSPSSPTCVSPSSMWWWASVALLIQYCTRIVSAVIRRIFSCSIQIAVKVVKPNTQTQKTSGLPVRKARRQAVTQNGWN
jgi:hypothetical protein